MVSMTRIGSVAAAGVLVLFCSPTSALAQLPPTPGVDDVVETVDDTKQTVDDTVDDTKQTVNDTVDDTKQTVNDTTGGGGQTVNDTTNDAGQTVNDTTGDAQQTVEDTTGGAVDAAGDAGETVGDAGAGLTGGKTSAARTSGSTAGKRAGKERAGEKRSRTRDARTQEPRGDGAALLRNIVSSGNLIAGPAPSKPLPALPEAKADTGLSLPLTGTQLMVALAITLVLMGGGALLWSGARRSSGRKDAFTFRRADARQ
jgi:hypothetical protein